MKSNDAEKNQEQAPALGDVLKSARAKRKMSVEELANATSVSTRDLERLESGDYGRLPAEIYVISFLERCARELSLPPEHLADLYRKESFDLKNKKKQKAPSVVRSKKLVVTPKLLIMAASAMGVILLAVYFWYQLSNLLAAPLLIVENPANDIITSEEAISISGQTSRDSHVFINEREIEADVNGFFKSDFHLEPGVNTAEIRSVNRFGKETISIKRIIKN